MGLHNGLYGRRGGAQPRSQQSVTGAGSSQTAGKPSRVNPSRSGCCWASLLGCSCRLQTWL